MSAPDAGPAPDAPPDPPEVGLEKIYRRNPETGAVLIEVALETYEDIFNEWDPAPYKRRDLDPDLRAYLTDCATGVPLGHALELIFSAPAARRDPAREDRVRTGLANFFAYEIKVVERKLGQLHHITAIHLAVALCLLAATTVMGRTPASSLPFSILHEGVTIGAWVFAWECISDFFFRRRDILRRIRTWRRFAVAPVRFVDTPSPAPPLDLRPPAP